MKTFVVIDKSTRREVYRYNNEVPVAFDGYPFELFAHDEQELADAPVSYSPRRLSKLAFLELFGDGRYLTLKALAPTNPAVALWLDKFQMATPDADGTSIDTSDPRTRAGLEYLMTIPELNMTQRDVETLLGGY